MIVKPCSSRSLGTRTVRVHRIKIFNNQQRISTKAGSHNQSCQRKNTKNPHSKVFLGHGWFIMESFTILKSHPFLENEWFIRAPFRYLKSSKFLMLKENSSVDGFHHRHRSFCFSTNKHHRNHRS